MILTSRSSRLQFQRPPVPRPSDVAALTFVCPACDVLLCDGVGYAYCPACDLPVDWVDPNARIHCCPTCDAMVNDARDSTAYCETCKRVMVCIHEGGGLADADASDLGSSRWLNAFVVGVSYAVFGMAIIAAVGPLLALALSPEWRKLALAVAVPWLLVPLILAGSILGRIGLMLREMRDLLAGPDVRVIHGLEHATVALLEQTGTKIEGGLTEPGSFLLWLQRDGGIPPVKQLRQRTREAIMRIQAGERSLAYHPKCGTSQLITVSLYSFVAVAAGTIGLFLTISLQTLAVLAALILILLIIGARPLGLLTQRLLTVSTNFKTAEVGRIEGSLRDDMLCYRIYVRVER